MKLFTSVIVPFYNEEALLKEAVSNLLNEQFDKEIILVNDGSVDGSPDIATELAKMHGNIKLITYDQNMGKGFAVKKGIEKSTGKFIAIFDADLEYFPSDLNRLIQTLKKDDRDFVCGSRFLGNKSRKNIYLRTYIANRFLSLLFSLIYKVKITDIATCLKVFKKELIEDINFEKNDFSIEVELIAKVVAKTKNYKEIPISYKARSYEEGKKIKFVDGFRYIFAILKFK